MPVVFLPVNQVTMLHIVSKGTVNHSNSIWGKKMAVAIVMKIPILLCPSTSILLGDQILLGPSTSILLGDHRTLVFVFVTTLSTPKMPESAKMNPVVQLKDKPVLTTKIFNVNPYHVTSLSMLVVLPVYNAPPLNVLRQMDTCVWSVNLVYRTNQWMKRMEF